MIFKLYVMDLFDYYEYRKLSNLAQNYSGCAWIREGKISVMSFICMRKSVFFFKSMYILCDTKCLGFSKPMFLFPHCTVMCCTMYKSTFLLARDSYGVK